MSVIQLLSWDGRREFRRISARSRPAAERQARAVMRELFGELVPIVQTWGGPDNEAWALSVDKDGRRVRAVVVEADQTDNDRGGDL